jgi:hypothetical protein
MLRAAITMQVRQRPPRLKPTILAVARSSMIPLLPEISVERDYLLLPLAGGGHFCPSVLAAKKKPPGSG